MLLLCLLQLSTMELVQPLLLRVIDVFLEVIGGTQLPFKRRLSLSKPR